MGANPNKRPQSHPSPLTAIFRLFGGCHLYFGADTQSTGTMLSMIHQIKKRERLKAAKTVRVVLLTFSLRE